jgi:hypothetical protein
MERGTTMVNVLCVYSAIRWPHISQDAAIGRSLVGLMNFAVEGETMYALRSRKETCHFVGRIWARVLLPICFATLILASCAEAQSRAKAKPPSIEPRRVVLCDKRTVTLHAIGFTKPQDVQWSVEPDDFAYGALTPSANKAQFKPGDKIPPAQTKIKVTASSGEETASRTIEFMGPCPDAGVDDRGVFDASFYVGLSVDTFAGDETLKYLNPQDAGQTHERAVGGFDFAVRLMGDKNLARPLDLSHRWQWVNNFWLVGETVHGVRSADVNCSTQGTDSPLCAKTLTPPANPGDQLFTIIRSATSLEGYGGLRWEFLGIQQQSETPMNVYLKAQAGFLDIAGQNGSALAMHDVALGAIATKGDYVNSYLEVGWGRSDTFAKKHSRKKIDAYLERKIDWLETEKGNPWMSFFAQITIDTDIGHGSDAIQSYIGFNFDLKRLLTKKSTPSTPSTRGPSPAPIRAAMRPSSTPPVANGKSPGIDGNER